MAGNVKNILISCGTGVVTSTLATNRLSKMLDERGYKGLYKTTQYKIAELASKEKISTMAALIDRDAI